MHFAIKKQTILLFEVESHNKITFKHRDFHSVNVFKNLKTAFNSSEVLIASVTTTFFCMFFCQGTFFVTVL